MAEIHHLRPTAEIAPIALLPGDPGRALALAQDLLDRPLMANHARGLWGYTGRTADGAQLTIQSTGLGGPSLAVVVTELAELGVRSAVRLGTCRALGEDLGLGDSVIVSAAVPADGASRGLGAGASVEPDPTLTRRLGDGGSWPAIAVTSTDLYHELPVPTQPRTTDGVNVRAVDLASATLLALGGRLGIRVAAALVVAEDAGGRRADDQLIERASLALGRSGARALQAT